MKLRLSDTAPSMPEAKEADTPIRNYSLNASPVNDDRPLPDVCLEIDGHLLRIVNVDNLVPQQIGHKGSHRTRFSYAAHEVTHFDLSGHRYAMVLVEEEAVASPRLPLTEDPQSLPIHLLLTNRELQIVQMVCMGLLTKQIAERLLLSEFTVRSYLKMIYCKLGVHSRGAMVYRYAQSMRLPTAAPCQR